jgi:hypothetical protein
MGALREEDLDTLACDCGAKRLRFSTYVDGALPLLGGEPVGAVTWLYDGEKFVDGVYEVRCEDCKKVVFSSDICPRCNASGKLSSALAAENSWPVPTECPKCGVEEICYSAFFPARVFYERKRADKARTSTEMHDPGFHGFAITCRDCGPVSERAECPLCGAAPPLRPRP